MIMNKKAFFSVMMFLFAGMMAYAGGDKDEFKVYGECGMCEDRIENAANEVEGVSSADWSQESEMLAVNYDASVVDVKEIHKAMADVGHDTKKVKAEDKAYNNLPSCCQYNRKECKAKEEHKQCQEDEE